MIISRLSLPHRRPGRRNFVIRGEYIWKETTPWKVRERLLQPQVNAMVSDSSMTVPGGNIAVEDICSPLKQTKPNLTKCINNASFPTYLPNSQDIRYSSSPILFCLARNK